MASSRLSQAPLPESDPVDGRYPPVDRRVIGGSSMPTGADCCCVPFFSRFARFRFRFAVAIEAQADLRSQPACDAKLRWWMVARGEEPKQNKAMKQGKSMNGCVRGGHGNHQLETS